MSYSSASVKALALKLISENTFRSMAEMLTHTPIDMQTFYRHVPKDSEDYEEIQRALLLKKAEAKKLMRNNWQLRTAAPNLQLAAYKLLADDDELEALGQVNKNNNNNAGVLSAQIVISSRADEAPPLAGSEDEIDMDKKDY